MSDVGTSNNLLNALGIEKPITQAPMAGVSTPELVAAVSNAGALGLVGIGCDECCQAQKTIEATRALTDKPSMSTFSVMRRGW